MPLFVRAAPMLDTAMAQFSNRAFPIESRTPLRSSSERIARLGWDIAHLACRTTDCSLILTQAAEHLACFFGADGCFIALPPQMHLPAGENYWFPTRLADALDPSQQLRLWTLDPLDRLVADSLPLAVEDLYATDAETACHCRSSREIWAQLQARSLLSVATSCQGYVNGIVVLWRNHCRPWAKRDRETLATVSDFVSLAIDRVVQSQTVRHLREQHHIASQKNLLVDRLTQAIGRSTDLQTLTESVVATLTHTRQVRQAMAILLTYTEPQLYATSRQALQTPPKKPPCAKATVVSQWFAEWGEWDGLGRAASPQRSNSPKSFWLSDCGCCREAFVRAPQALAIDDIRSIRTPFKIAFDVDRFPAILVVPLISPHRSSDGERTVLGFLVLQHDRPRCWNVDDLELAQFVSTQLSYAILQSQTLQQVHNLVRDRTAQLQRSLDVQAKLYEQTRHQIDQLRQLNQQKDEFLSTVSHELRTPLTSMTLAIRMLHRGELSPEQQQKYWDILERQCRQETQLVEDLLKLQELENDPPTPHIASIDLPNLLRESIESFEQCWAHKDLSVTVELPSSELSLYSNVENLKRVLEELLTNAGKYAFAGTTVVCRIAHESSRASSPRIAIELANVGSAIEPEDLPYIFDKFRRGSGVTKQAVAGTGLGLALAKSLVQQLQGSIDVTSDPLDDRNGNYTCFRITLPQFFDTVLDFPELESECFPTLEAD